MCTRQNRPTCWIFYAQQDVIDTQFSRLWQLTYSMYTFFTLVEETYTVAEERAIYERLRREGLLENW